MTCRMQLDIRPRRGGSSVQFNSNNGQIRPVPVATRSKAWVCDRSPAEIVGSESHPGGLGCLSVVSAVCCQVDVSATG